MGGYDWLREASEYMDVLTSSFPEKYERPKHEALGIKNWEYCPYGSDVYTWRKWYKPLEEKDNVVSGLWHIRSYMRGGVGDRIHSRTLQIMKLLQDKYKVKCIFFLNFDGHKSLPSIKSYVNALGLDVELVKHVHPNIFNEMLSKHKVFFEEYQCPNYSRATAVSASVGTPQVGSDMNTPSNVCFPYTTSIHGDWDDYTSKIEQLLTDEVFYRKLLTDEVFYRTIQKNALNMSSYLYYPALKERLLKLYRKYKHA